MTHFTSDLTVALYTLIVHTVLYTVYIVCYTFYILYCTHLLCILYCTDVLYMLYCIYCTGRCIGLSMLTEAHMPPTTAPVCVCDVYCDVYTNLGQTFDEDYKRQLWRCTLLTSYFHRPPMMVVFLCQSASRHMNVVDHWGVHCRVHCGCLCTSPPCARRKRQSRGLVSCVVARSSFTVSNQVLKPSFLLNAKPSFYPVLFLLCL